MKITVRRLHFDTSYTTGMMSIDGEKFCDTLEDANRDGNRNGRFDSGERKIPGETCIPFGKYPVSVTMSPKFKRELPLIHNVPEFEGIRIHRGNKPQDTAGCILVGESRKGGTLINSTKYEVELVSRCKKAIDRGEKITIDII